MDNTSTTMQVEAHDVNLLTPPIPPSRDAKRRAEGSPEVLRLTNPMPITLEELSKIVESMNLNKRVVQSSLKKESTTTPTQIVTAMNNIGNFFNKVADAYRVLSTRIEMLGDLREMLSRETNDRSVTCNHDNLKMEIADMVRKEVQDAVSRQFSVAAKEGLPYREASQKEVVDIFAGEVKEAIKEIKSTIALAPAKSNLQTYANVSARSVAVAGPPAFDNTHLPRTNTVEFTIVPMIGFTDKFRTSTDILNKFQATIRPVDYSLRAQRWIRLHIKTVKVIAETVDLEKLQQAEELKRAGLCIEVREKLKPRLIIRGIPADTAPNNLVEMIVAANLPNANPEEVKLVYMYPVRLNRSSTSCVIETNAKNRSELIRQGRIYVGYACCKVEDHIIIKQCYKCLDFGHIAKDCQRPPVCANCSGGHATRDCQSHSALKCRNCCSAKMNDTAHSALDARKCHIIKMRVEGKARSIDYVYNGE